MIIHIPIFKSVENIKMMPNRFSQTLVACELNPYKFPIKTQMIDRITFISSDNSKVRVGFYNELSGYPDKLLLDLGWIDFGGSRTVDIIGDYSCIVDSMFVAFFKNTK